jgi:NADPH:quinone reductase-like Zn-dependent oxidoreductase
MKAYWIRTEQGRAVLELKESTAPEPKPGELLVRVRVAALNRGEFIVAHGLHKAGAEAKRAGQEAAGEVVSVGAGVTEFKPADRVMGRAPGGFAELAVMDARETMRVPDRLSWEEAASVPLVFLVAYDMLFTQGELRLGDWLLVTGVSSGVGIASLQTAKVIGAKVIGTTGSQAKLERLAALGLDLGIATRGADFAARALDATGGKGVDLAINTVGGTVFEECVRALAYKGRLATVGYLDGVMQAQIDLEALHAKRLRLFGVSNKLRSAAERAETVRGFVRDVLPAFADGRIRPVIDRVFDFAQLPAAKAYMESNAQIGKIVLRAAP